MSCYQDILNPYLEEFEYLRLQETWREFELPLLPLAAGSFFFLFHLEQVVGKDRSLLVVQPKDSNIQIGVYAGLLTACD